MLQVSCIYCHCRRHGRGEQLPDGWKVFGDAALCRRCRRWRYGLRSLTMAVIEPVGAAWRESGVELEESWIHATPRYRVWTAGFVGGQPVVRVFIGDRWREMRLKRGAWSGGQRAAYDKIATGAAYAEIFFHRAPDDDTQATNIMCRMVAWLPREPVKDVLQCVPPVRASQPVSGVFEVDLDLGKTDIRNLREAIRANRVSFPSQVPTFAESDRPDLQRKLAQLYFVLGRNSPDIGRRFDLAPGRVQKILSAWKHAAVKALYI